ncbi:hypothetical protein ASF69_04685 [Rhizobium sp. Leaf311]|uniref:hypothetical protein n=1 Tax=Rhizobium sp. Leaf311 TaxID=1736332 RepID=UPI0007132ADA|nr:hypothetical protein [Rhizobium sp. Leaf311]KQQ46527.1 hypothetical protein ASF69_04685 [Rhizobium sp. Leaf311]
MRKVLFATAAILLAATSAGSQVRTAPDIPQTADTEVVKRERCAASISDFHGWQLGQAKRLRDWCRDNGYITYDQQLDAEARK